MEKDMTRWELLTLLLAIEALLEDEKSKKALNLVKTVINEIKSDR